MKCLLFCLAQTWRRQKTRHPVGVAVAPSVYSVRRTRSEVPAGGRRFWWKQGVREQDSLEIVLLFSIDSIHTITSLCYQYIQPVPICYIRMHLPHYLERERKVSSMFFWRYNMFTCYSPISAGISYRENGE